MTIDLGSGKSALSMTLEDVDSGREKLLFERKGSRCHFNDDIYFEGYIITLRVDWGDIQNTDPVLDADIYKNAEGQRGEKLRNGDWHHTSKNYDIDENRSIYVFEFNNLKLRLGTKTSFGLSVSMDAFLVKKSDREKQV